MQDVQIKLTAKHLVEGNWDTSTHHYEGKRVQKAASWYVTYKEQMEGAGEVSTTIKLSDKAITLIRQGGVSSRQQFEKGASTQSLYQSPYGPFTMETHTNKLRIQYENELPVLIEISYQLWMNEQYTGEHELRIELGK